MPEHTTTSGHRTISTRSTGRTPAGTRPEMPAADGSCIRVLCAEDHAVLVEGLKAQFAIDGRIHVVGSVSSPEHLLEEVARLKPDIVLLDIEMPGPDVFEMADRMRHMHPSLRFAFLSAHIRHGYLAAAYKCGAWGYFAKGDELHDIVAGIMELAHSTAGTFVMGPKVAQLCARPAPTSSGPRSTTANTVMEKDRPVAPPLESLTAREIEVLRLIGKGQSRNEIAAELSRSAKTIDGHQERMMRKLHIDSRAELMRFAIREGLAEA